MKQAMKKLGMQQEEIEASEVVIHTPEKRIIIRNPSVVKIKMGGQESFQITGDSEEEPLEQELEQESAEITVPSEEDILTVMEQAHASMEASVAALESSKGDIAAAILALQKAGQSKP